MKAAGAPWSAGRFGVARFGRYSSTVVVVLVVEEPEPIGAGVTTVEPVTAGGGAAVVVVVVVLATSSVPQAARSMAAPKAATMPGRIFFAMMMFPHIVEQW
jgi:hypothetical protein